MTIKEQMKTVVAEITSKYGKHYKISLKELCEILDARFGTNSNSVIPSDYCYDRTNKGIKFSKMPHLFIFCGDGMYECVGENYSFNGAVYTCEKGTKNDIIVGSWKDGRFSKNEKWDFYNLTF